MRLKNKDIAQMLGISATAVSLAVNGRPGVSDETRRKVLSLIAQSNQQALEDAASIVGEPGRIVFVVHKSSGQVVNENQFFANLVEVVQQRAMQLGFSLTLAHHLPGQGLDEFMAYLHGLGADGLLVQATELDEAALDAYLALGLPTVLLDGYFDLKPVEAVTLDDQTSMYRAVAYACSMGHRDIGYLAGRAPIKNFEHHLDGFWKGVRDFGLEGDGHPVFELGCSYEDAKRDMAALLTKPPKGFALPTCLICDLDNIALGAMSALKDAGYTVPDDVSIIGYGNTGVAAISSPPLTTTQINMFDSGRIAVDRLADRMRNPRNPTVTITTVSSYLVERGSVRRLDGGQPA